jgi:hypothetical protein
MGALLVKNDTDAKEAGLAGLDQPVTIAEQMDAILRCWIQMGEGQPKDLIKAVDTAFKRKKLTQSVTKFLDGLENDNEDIK